MGGRVTEIGADVGRTLGCAWLSDGESVGTRDHDTASGPGEKVDIDMVGAPVGACVFSPILMSIVSSKSSTELLKYAAKVPEGDVVGCIGTGDLVGGDTTNVRGAGVAAVRLRARVARRPVRVGASVACTSVPDGSPGLRETVNEAPNSSITAARSCPGIIILLQAPAVEPVNTIQTLYPSAIPGGPRCLPSDEPPCYGGRKTMKAEY